MIRLDAPIAAVTVYPGQARVTRRGRVTLPGGPARVLVGGLPTRLQSDSVRVSGTGAATVLGVDVAPERHPRPTTSPSCASGPMSWRRRWRSWPTPPPPSRPGSACSPACPGARPARSRRRWPAASPTRPRWPRRARGSRRS
ncbi:DUF4140 domain-containing protein [Actinokineospora soli]|uniref:DUF4140 domain-containing protein n=1 Tax=Actinokineospora soli TaxID=1048753 RepID=A0ABW2TLX9_9PSEU